MWKEEGRGTGQGGVAVRKEWGTKDSKKETERREQRERKKWKER